MGWFHCFGITIIKEANYKELSELKWVFFKE